MQAPGRSTGWATVAFVTLLGFWLPASLDLPVTRPSEMRYVEAARQMDMRRSWAVPVMHGEVYAEKPPLWFWAVIGAERITGDYVRGARFVSAASCTVGVFATAGLAAALLPAPAAAPLAAAVLATSALLLDRGWRPLIDPLLFGCCALALWGLLAGGGGGSWRRASARALAALALAAAVLTKGPVGVLVVVLGAVTIGTCRGGWRAVPWAGLALALLVAAAAGLGWLTWASREAGSWYWDRMLFGQVSSRVAEGAAHEEPWWFYVPSVLVHWLPWTALLPGVVALACSRSAGEDRGPARGALLWFALGLLLFSLAAGKRTGYLLPLYPGLALATAWAIARAETGPVFAERAIGWPLATGRWLYPLAAAAFAFGGLAMALVQAGLGERLPRIARAWAQGLPASAPIAPVLASVVLGAVALRERRDAEARGRLVRRALRLSLAVAIAASTVFWTFLPPLARRDDPAPALGEIAARLPDGVRPAFYGRRLTYFWTFQRGDDRVEVLEDAEQLARRLDAPDHLFVVARGRDHRRLPAMLRDRLRPVWRAETGSGVLLLEETTPAAARDGNGS